MNIKNNTTVNKNTINQNQLVISYLKRNSRRSLTSEQICEAINSGLKEVKSRTRLTITQISKCLNRFNEKDMVKQVDKNGKFSNGRKAARWTYVRP
jgi:two-component SAPR family response regulator